MRTTVVTEYVRRLSDDGLYELRMRFNQDLAGDKAFICEFLSQDKELDRWLGKAGDSDEFFYMLDEIGEAVNRECNRRDTKPVYNKAPVRK